MTAMPPATDKPTIEPVPNPLEESSGWLVAEADALLEAELDEPMTVVVTSTPSLSVVTWGAAVVAGGADVGGEVVGGGVDVVEGVVEVVEEEVEDVEVVDDEEGVVDEEVSVLEAEVAEEGGEAEDGSRRLGIPGVVSRRYTFALASEKK